MDTIKRIHDFVARLLEMYQQLTISKTTKQEPPPRHRSLMEN